MLILFLFTYYLKYLDFVLHYILCKKRRYSDKFILIPNRIQRLSIYLWHFDISLNENNITVLSKFVIQLSQRLNRSQFKKIYQYSTQYYIQVSVIFSFCYFFKNSINQPVDRSSNQLIGQKTNRIIKINLQMALRSYNTKKSPNNEPY